MTIQLKNEDDVTILQIEGRIDSNTSNQLQDELIASLDTNSQILLDFTEVSYISSAGLRVLLMGQKKAKSQNGKMELANVSSNVMSVFETVGFTKILTFK